ncbi:ubiquitin-related domain-containing protein [Fimicolochytrium jonesii]|uniref:ubiquitin-related domain-containing protein n=1 Tax=Fimicolochytrium jonesii TaxID=1396493 RepID=UPI0022FDF2B4|nr:ubiquitin-related domain-containing protein [Fimicolochytrium jonesii]KAI8823510.1 ubiquitin-related domain-containing protein [Fimicolochytrium jonesii]
MNLTLNPADEAAFFSNWLSQIASRPRRYEPTYEPSPAECTAQLPPASRPFPLRETSATPASANEAEITIKALKGGDKPFTLRVSRLEPIGDLKARIAAESGVAIAAQRLVFSGKGLSDNKTLLDYGIETGATIHLLRKPGVSADAKPVVPTTDAEKTAAKKPEETESAAVFQAKGKDPALWKGFRTVIDEHFEDSANAQTLFDEFVRAYHGLCGPLSVSQRDALKKAEAESA